MKKYIIPLLAMFIISCSDKSKSGTSLDDSAIRPSADKCVALIKFDSVPLNAGMAEHKNVDSLFLKNKVIKQPDMVKIGKEKFYILEGDLLMNEYDYLQYKITKLQEKGNTTLESKLVGMIVGDSIVKWPSNYVIKYCITKNSFRTLAEYNTVKANLKLAITDWENTCKVKFKYIEAKDNANLLAPTVDLTFVVLGYNTGGSFIASSFFPNDPVSKRHLLIDPSYFTSQFDKTGVLRHELGHILGFRHEHIRAEAPLSCRGESTTGTINHTPYDPKSVMHYFCGGMGSLKLQITDIDRKGSQYIYGVP